MKKTSFLAVLILLVGVSAYPWPWGGGGGGGGAGDNITITNSPTTTLPWDNITSRPTINSVTVTGAVLDNVSNYPATLVRGPASATDSYFAYFDGTSGKLLKDGQSTVNPAFSTINVYGANALNLGTAGTYAGQIRFKSAGHASNYFPIIAPATFTDNVGWTLPATGASGGTGFLLSVSNSGVMGYTDPSTIGGSGSVSDNAYNATNWDGVTTVAPSMNAVRDKIETMGTITGATASRGLVATTTTLGLIETCGTNEILKWSGSLWACSADAQSAGSNPAFDNVTTGTNANALHVGTGGSLDATGSGTITATALSAQYTDWSQSSGATSVANRPTINSVVVTGVVLDNVTNYPAGLLRTTGSAANLTSFPTLNQDTTGKAAGSVSDNAYNATDWNNVTTVAPSMNAVRDKFETLGTMSVKAAGTMTDTKACIYTSSGDQIVCNTTIGGGGDFSGPASSTDNAVVLFNGTGGKTGKNSPCTVGADNAMTCTGGFSTAQSAGTAGSIKLYELSGGGSNYVAWKAADALAGDVTWTLPNADSAGAFYSNGSGAVSLKALGTLGALAAGTMTDTKACIYTTSGTQVVCNTTLGGLAYLDNGAAINITGNAGTASALASDPSDCSAGQLATGIAASGNLTCTATPSGLTSVGATTFTGALTGNASTATALAADPANCSAGQIALGVTAAGVAECTATPSGLTSVGATTFTGALTGNASTATALAADPADCSAGQIATGIAASGALSCTATPSGLTSVGATTFTGALTGNASTATTASNVAVGSDANGDILVRGASAYGRLAAVAAGQPLLSGGATTAPAYAGYTFSATAGQTYTFPATSKTLMATDGNTSGTAANVSGTPALPNGTTATRQAADDATDKLATDNWVITQAYAKINRTKTFSFAIDNVIATDNVLMWRAPVAVTLTRADCYATVDNVVGSLMECSTSNVTSCSVLDAWTVTNATNPFSDTSMTDGAVAAGAWVRWSTTSVGSALNRLTCTIQYNE